MQYDAGIINQQGSGCSGAMLCIAPYKRPNALSQYVKHVTAIFFLIEKNCPHNGLSYRVRTVDL